MIIEPGNPPRTAEPCAADAAERTICAEWRGLRYEALTEANIGRLIPDAVLTRNGDDKG